MRIRTIKPEFFEDEDLARLPAHDRLMFIGLWGLADKNGVLEYRPEWIKARIFPYETGEAVDASRVLPRLVQGKHLVHYRVDGRDYLWIRTFTQHQRITGKEAQGGGRHPLPPKDLRDGSREGSGREALEKHPGNDRETPEKHPGAQEQGTGNREQGTGNREQGTREQGTQEHSTPSPSCGGSPEGSPIGGGDDATCRSGWDQDKIALLHDAIERKDRLRIVRLFGATYNDQLEPEWERDVEQVHPRQVAILFAWARHIKQPIRLPSGWRKVTEAWASLPRDDQKEIIADMVTAYGMPRPKWMDHQDQAIDQDAEHQPALTDDAINDELQLAADDDAMIWEVA